MQLQQQCYPQRLNQPPRCLAVQAALQEPFQPNCRCWRLHPCLNERRLETGSGIRHYHYHLQLQQRVQQPALQLVQVQVLLA